MSATLEELGGWPSIVGALVAGRDLPASQARAAMAEILAGDATDAQIAGFLVALRSKGETVDELSGLLDAMLEAAPAVPVDPAGLVDTCGTGGDRRHTINVSTAAALVVAGAGGRVCKHGNRAASSASGSADVLEALGVVIDLGPEEVARCIDEVGLGFCFAQRFHPAMRHAGPVRRELGVPTAFNFLGPMANPARVKRQVLGVSDPAMAARMVSVLAARGTERALVVFGHDGLDELTTTTTSTVLELRDGEVREYVVDPPELGVDRAELGALRGGDADANATLTRRVLDGDAGPHVDIIVLNAAAGLVAAGLAEDLAAGVELARSAVASGAAGEALDGLVAASKALAR